MSNSNKEALKYTMAYLSFIVGAGFTTGQEVLQFFVNYGNLAYLAVLISGVIVAFSTRQVVKLGYNLEADSYDISLDTLFGKNIGKVIDYLILFFLYGSAVIMIAGGGAAFYDGFSVPAWLGSLIIVALLFVVLLMKFDNIIKVLGSVTPFLVIAVLIIAGYNIINPTIPMDEVNRHTDISKSPTTVWWFDAITYAGLIVGTSFSFLTVIGSNNSSRKAARRSGLIGGIIFSALLAVMVAGLLANIEQANSVELPTLLLADQIHPFLRYLMAGVMVAVIFNSCIGMLYPFLTRFTVPYSSKYKVMLAILLILGYIFSFVGFADLVSLVFPLFGYIGLFISIVLFFRWSYFKFFVKPKD